MAEGRWRAIGSPAAAAKWLIVMLLVVIAGRLVLEVGWGMSSAAAQNVGSTRSGNTFAIGGQVTKDTYGLYLVDMDNCTICVYQWVAETGGRGKLRLMASRTYAFDRQLDEYNTEPLPSEIKNLVAAHRRMPTTTSNPS